MSRAVLLVGLFCGLARALFTQQQVIAIKVPDGKLVVDGRPEKEWREIAAYPNNLIEIKFSDYSKIVLLGRGDSVLNGPPENEFVAPAKGSASMMAAYDAEAMYFFFLVRENDSFNPAGSNCLATDLWKTHSVEVFVDPNTYDPVLYPTLFSADAAQASYGTSPKSLQLAKPTWTTETRNFFRDRTVGNRFAIRTGTGVRAVSANRTANDKLTFGVEIKIPHVRPVEFTPSRSMFVSWGYNHFPDAPRTNCDADPIAYRWAKHTKDYADSTLKPPGWKPGDKVHFDPLRSYDGWGKMLLDPWVSSGQHCSGSALVDTLWDLASWSSCRSLPVTIRVPNRPSRSISPDYGVSGPFGGTGRDIRGRLTPTSPGILRILAVPGREEDATFLH